MNDLNNQDIFDELESRFWVKNKRHMLSYQEILDIRGMALNSESLEPVAMVIPTAKTMVMMKYIFRDDKNGKKIFVGDILEVTLLDGSQIYGVVYYSTDEVRYFIKFDENDNDCKANTEMTFGELLHDGRIRVTGNVFENQDDIDDDD